MRSITYVKVFKDREVLDEMLSLRRAGWSYSSLGRAFGIKHTSVMYQCKRAGVVLSPYQEAIRGKTPISLTVVALPPVPKEKPMSQKKFVSTLDKNWGTDEFGERICRGKSYRQVLKEAKARRTKSAFIAPVSAFKDPATKWRSISLVG